MSRYVCPACLRMRDTCTCEGYCRECQSFTNHTTAQHLTALEEQGSKCYECGDVKVKEDGDTCGECLSELAEMYHPDEGGSQ